MRIPFVTPTPGLEPAKGPARPASGRADEPTASADESVHVRVSAESRALSLAADGDIDAAKVSRLKASIEAGTFRVDAREIAERIARGG
ncbi:MAG: flagellar biosynthesis anti-sigma factor FlgM [Myxococcaceae bacterium]|nr:MAG: flagellar biosynthesis anti-sigma factor FlgM [Myxococcaceae bacterium]